MAIRTKELPEWKKKLDERKAELAKVPAKPAKINKAKFTAMSRAEKDEFLLKIAIMLGLVEE